MIPFVVKRILNEQPTFFSIITYSQTMFTLKEMYHVTDVPSLSSPLYPLLLRKGSVSLKDNSKAVYRRASRHLTQPQYSVPHCGTYLIWSLPQKNVKRDKTTKKQQLGRLRVAALVWDKRLGTGDPAGLPRPSWLDPSLSLIFLNSKMRGLDGVNGKDSKAPSDIVGFYQKQLTLEAAHSRFLITALPHPTPISISRVFLPRCPELHKAPPLPDTWSLIPNLGHQALTIRSAHTLASADPLGTGSRGGLEVGLWSPAYGPKLTPLAGPGHPETLGLLQLLIVNLQKTSIWTAAKTT